MTDHNQELVERLRERARVLDSEEEQPFADEISDDYLEAAYEIERLRAAIAAAQSDGVVEALRRCDKLFDNLWDAVPWGQTRGLDIAALNEVPALVKRTLAALSAPEPVEEQKQ